MSEQSRPPNQEIPKIEEKETKTSESQRGRSAGEISEEALMIDTIEKAGEYFAAQSPLRQRLKKNERYYSTLQWDEYSSKSNVEKAPEPTSNYIFSVLLDRHADMMDNMPTQNILPRDESAVEEAGKLKNIIPRVFEINEYHETYSDKIWDIIKQGYAIEGVLFDPTADNSLGEIAIRLIDPMGFLWQPGVSRLQDSENIFVISNVPKHKIMSETGEDDFTNDKNKIKSISYPSIDGEVKFDDTDNVLVIDRYYYVDGELNFCKVVGNKLVYSTELDDSKEFDCLYADNKYPFIITTLWKVKNSLAGFGFVDVLEKIQIYVDKTDQAISINTAMHAMSRYLIRDGVAINEEDLKDWSIPFVKIGQSNRITDVIKDIRPTEMPQYVIGHRKSKIDEMKEISGSNEFSRGETGGGVTAAAAIKALQEAGNKISRDILKGIYHSHKLLVYKIIERIREFYSEPRTFRIPTDEPDKFQFIEYTNENLIEKRIYREEKAEYTDEDQFTIERPEFDIMVEAEKVNPFSQMANNELAITLYQLGFFNPDRAVEARAALTMMDFEQIEQIRNIIDKEDQRAQMMERLAEKIQMLERGMQGMAQQQPAPPQPGEPPMPGIEQ